MLEDSTPPLSETLCLSSCLFKVPPENPVCCNWSAHTHLSHHSPLCLRSVRPCHQLPLSFTSTVNIDMNYANECHSVMSCSHLLIIKVDSTDEAFQEQCFLWENQASVGADFDLFSTFKIVTCARTCKKS